MQNRLKGFFSKLGFNFDSDFNGADSLSVKLGKSNFFLYSVGKFSDIYFIYLPANDFNNELFDTHSLIWNDNKTEVFVTISDYETHLCSAKYKPDKMVPLSCKLASFDYGVNSPQIDPERLHELKKESIDYGFFWDFVRKNLKENMRHGVDDDLLLNLIHLKADLKEIVPQGKTYILIERCLFIKFLEDRNFLAPHTLFKVLKEPDSKSLINKFTEVNRDLNGDIFTEDIFEVHDIPSEALKIIYDFFTTDYRSQIKLFPYNFSILPIELLSNIYEAFLKVEKKISGGVYYTPTILVDLILNHTLQPLFDKLKYPTCIDFSCGSGVFLVKAFERLIDRHGCHSDFEKKKKILKNCIFGIEKDEVAARITIFSLYLKLLEGERPDLLRKSIKNGKIKFPELFNYNIQRKNTLFDKIILENEDGKVFDVFDVVVGNPPWGVNPYNDPEVTKSSKMNLANNKLNAVSGFQSSQYFILKAQDFMSENSIAGVLSNNSNLLATKSQRFRLKMIDDYQLEAIYDFTHCNSILFKKRKLKISCHDSASLREINLGADEPAAALILKKKVNDKKRTLKYITPSLNILTRLLKVISVKPSDIKSIPTKLLREDLIWRVLTVGDIEDYDIIKKLKQQKSKFRLKASRGFGFKRKGEPIWKSFSYFDKDCIDHFKLHEPKKIGETGRSIRRPARSIKDKILVKRYIEKDVRVKAAHDFGAVRYKENLIAIESGALDNKFLLGLMNSSLISYFLFHNSAQIGKGTFNMLQTNEIESIPIPPDKSIDPALKVRFKEVIANAQDCSHVSQEMLGELDEMVFDIYNLKEYEKQRIRDFFNIKKRRYRAVPIVNKIDFNRYSCRFREVFKFILRDDKFLNIEAFYSPTVGAGIVFSIVDISLANEDILIKRDSDLAKIIINITKRQLKKSEKEKLLKQDKLKLYGENNFTILKSNYYDDWTETEAIKDANEEIELFVRSLPEK